MKTRTRNALGLTLVAAATALGLGLVARSRDEPDLRGRALDAVPSGALLVAVVDLGAIRASPLAGPLLREGREIPGLGKVRDVCGFDPLDTVEEIAVAVPAAGDSGEFGLVAAGSLDGEALLQCASKVIEARGGDAVITGIGGFRTVRDATLSTPGGEIAVRPRDLVLLGAGAYLRAMIDSADRRAPTIRTSVAHGILGKEIAGADIRITAVLTPEQRQTLALELEREGGASSPATSILAGALGVRVGPTVGLHGVITCETEAPCAELARTLSKARDERAADYATRLIGVGALLDRLTIEAKGDRLHLRAEIPAEEAAAVVERVLALRGFRHPMPQDKKPQSQKNKRPPEPPEPPEPPTPGAGSGRPARPDGAAGDPPADLDREIRDSGVTERPDEVLRPPSDRGRLPRRP